jgi:ABC-2 type transport system permease protein
MLGASLYLIVCSTRNRVRTRLRRLREPRYLVGAIVGSAYLYFAVFNRGRGGPDGTRRSSRGLAGLAPAWQATGSTLGGLGLFALAAAAWLLPAKSGLLEFSRAEAAFLFPAPVTRRQLLLHKVMRSQIGSLLASIVVVAFFAPASASKRLQFAVAMWALFVSARVYFAAVALTRTRLSSPEAASRRAAWPAVAVCVAATLVVCGAIIRQFAAQPAASLPDLVVRLARTTATGLPAVLIWPFAAVLRPLAAADLTAYLVALTGSFAVLAVTTLWMLSGAEAFDLESAESDAQGAETAARRAAPKARGVGWTLPLTGRAEGLFLWKNAMQSFRASDAGVLRVALPTAVALTGLSFAVMAANRLRGAAGIVSAFSLVISVFGVLFGPQLMRLDLRADLQHLDVLKTWPVRSASVIRGEILWPASVVTATVWIGILGAAIFSEAAFPWMPPAWRWVSAASGIVAAPALVVPQYIVHNAIAVFFPAWVPTSLQQPRGVDAMGQRLIMLAAVIVSLLLFSVPGALAGGVVWLALRSLLDAAALLPASVAFTVTVLVEVLMATELLAPAYDRLDLTSVERSER